MRLCGYPDYVGAAIGFEIRVAGLYEVCSGGGLASCDLKPGLRPVWEAFAVCEFVHQDRKAR